MNTCNFTGRITKELELKTTSSGINYVRFTIAVNRTNVKEGDKKADFLPCIAWKKTAELLCKYCGKGSFIGITGKLTESTTGEGESRKTYYDIVVNSVDLLSGKPKPETPPEPPKQEPPIDTEYDLPFDLEGA